MSNGELQELTVDPDRERRRNYVVNACKNVNFYPDESWVEYLLDAMDEVKT